MSMQLFEEALLRFEEAAVARANNLPTSEQHYQRKRRAIIDYVKALDEQRGQMTAGRTLKRETQRQPEPPQPTLGKNALRVLRERKIAGELFAEAGDIVYPCTKADYGCASYDTRGLGVEHISVTKDRNGDYPFFTIPVDDVELYRG